MAQFQKHNLQKYGWHRDLPDQRDLFFSVEQVETLAPVVSLRSLFPPVYNQMQLGSCSANSVGGIFEYEQGVQKEKEFTPSRLFIYYNERAYVGQQNQDSGSTIRMGIKSLVQYGVAPESEWPYNISNFSVQPPPNVYTDAEKNKVLRYARVPQSIRTFQATLSQGHPISFGFTVYESFESEEVARTGIVPLPEPNEVTLGGHAVILVGYDSNKNGSLHFEVRNSWGSEWGDQGYFWMPAAYLADANLSSDFWVIDQIT